MYDFLRGEAFLYKVEQFPDRLVQWSTIENTLTLTSAASKTSKTLLDRTLFMSQKSSLNIIFHISPDIDNDVQIKRTLESV